MSATDGDWRLRNQGRYLADLARMDTTGPRRSTCVAPGERNHGRIDAAS
jgi:hypothetical protein